jgi:CheY-like chemotaxis protein
MSRPVLVVDDEPDFLTVYERLLKREGYQVVAAGTRRDGLVVVERQPLALVICDIKLPDGDGLDVVRAARATPTPPAVIVATAFVSGTSQKLATDAGAAAYLPKPFRVSDFISLVQRLAPRSGNGPMPP